MYLHPKEASSKKGTVASPPIAPIPLKSNEEEQCIYTNTSDPNFGRYPKATS